MAISKETIVNFACIRTYIYLVNTIKAGLLIWSIVLLSTLGSRIGAVLQRNSVPALVIWLPLIVLFLAMTGTYIWSSCRFIEIFDSQLDTLMSEHDPRYDRVRISRLAFAHTFAHSLWIPINIGIYMSLYHPGDADFAIILSFLLSLAINIALTSLLFGSDHERIARAFPPTADPVPPPAAPVAEKSEV